MNKSKNANQMNFDNLSPKQEKLLDILRKTSKKIAPVWPLENFVAVNPYLGFTDQKFDYVAQDLAAAVGIQMTLPISFYLQKLQDGELKREDIAAVLKKRNSSENVNKFIESLGKNPTNAEETQAVATVADVAKQVTQKDWARFMTARVSDWAASYFDNGQAVWSAANKNDDLFISWKREAEIDRTPELSGLANFRKLINILPDNPLGATQIALGKLGIAEEGLSLYLHRILLRLGGWAAYAARLDWDSELYGGKDGKQIEFLAVLTCWEAALLESLENSEVNKKWREAKIILSMIDVQKDINKQLVQKLILQEAFDFAAQGRIISKFQTQNPIKKTSKQAKAQAIFCIDVRSEVYRRNLELVDSEIETLGFAGFFAFPINYVPIGHNHGEANCPVLLKTGPTIMEQTLNEHENEKAVNKRVLNHQVEQLWKTFKSGAVTCFSFVSLMGLSYLPKLFTDSFGITRPVPHPNDAGLSKNFSKKKTVSLVAQTINNETVGILIPQQIQMAKNALKAMSLADNFAKFVLIVGHGASTVNNPHATGYDCGACGGHSGEANARVAAAVLNNLEVRNGLEKEGIHIPENTVFLACLHDTTTDELTIFNEYEVPTFMETDLTSLKQSLANAGRSARSERYLKLESDTKDSDKSILFRSKDWSQIRPEWGLAGCSAFVVAPRERTKGLDFGGSSFLHSYDWKKDEGFPVLELIMTAPMVVTSWINLQYYGSTVDNKHFGSGNKTLHNVTSGVGVLEGFSGDLRVGLPFQAVHDGEKYQHEPLKLNVIIEAPIEAMNAILEKHKMVRDLCDNGWIHLLAMNESGKVSHRYNGNMKWEVIEEKQAA